MGVLAAAADFPPLTILKMLRSLLTPDSVFHIGGRNARLEPGDIISLGTPGGTVLTARPQGFVDFLLFWRGPRERHDVFFHKDAAHYLHHGDEVFFWAEGLGCQRLRIRRHRGVVDGP